MYAQIQKLLLPGFLLYLLWAPAALGAESRVAVDVASLGPQVGDTVPGLNLPDQNGQLHSLDSIAGANGTMLLFHRSADW